MKLSLMAAVSENGVIGAGLDIPWHAQGEQLLFKAMTYHQWLLVGRKTFESMGKLAHRKYAVISRLPRVSADPDILYFQSIEQALMTMEKVTNQLYVAGGGEIYREMIARVDTIHLSRIHCEVAGDIIFPALPEHYRQVFAQKFHSNIDYTYQIWQRT